MVTTLPRQEALRTGWLRGSPGVPGTPKEIDLRDRPEAGVSHSGNVPLLGATALAGFVHGMAEAAMCVKAEPLRRSRGPERRTALNRRWKDCNPAAPAADSGHRD